MGREVFMVRDGAIVWYGVIGGGKGEIRSAREGFEEAWRRALAEGAVVEADAGIVQFRSLKPDIKLRRRVALRAVSA